MNVLIEHQLKINKYDGKLHLVRAISDLIEQKYSDLFYAVLVHGSIATKEVISYSDFDGLLIVKDEFINSRKFEKFKYESMRLILSFDPLQHHGWFQIKEGDLLNYPEGYLPVSTLKHSELIYPNTLSLDLKVQYKNDVDYLTTLKNILNQFEKRELDNWRPKNVYELKSILSQIMLIPCLYYSVINNDGIFKRESFNAVKAYFGEKEWMPIRIASNIRSQWEIKMNSVQRKLLKEPNSLIRKIVTRFFSPKIPLEIQRQLNQQFYSNLMLLINKIKSDIS